MEGTNFKSKTCLVMLQPLTPKQQTSLCTELQNAIEERSLLTVRSKQKLLMDLKELEDHNIDTELAARKAKAIDELLRSESSYINQLKTIETYFMKPIKEQCILSAEDYLILFGNIRTIRHLNEEFLKKFEAFHINIGEVFIEMAPFLKMYSTYAFYFKKGLNILLNAHTKQTALFKFLESQESRPEVQQKLSSLLIAPIQRIPRYRLLLQQILDNTNVSDPTYLLTKEALGKIQEIVEHIDGLVGFQENAQRLIELQYSFKGGFPSIIKADRKLIKEGVLRKLSAKHDRLHKKYFILLTDIIMYCDILKRNITSINSLKCRGILPLNKCEVSSLYNGTFKLQCSNVELSISHKDTNECQKWADSIKGTIKTYKENKCSLRKDSSSRRPAFGKLISEYQESGVSPGIPRKKRHLDCDDVNKCLPAKLTKRKCIRTSTDFGRETVSVQKTKLPEYINIHEQDSLYPLRRQLVDKNVTFAESIDFSKSPIAGNVREHQSESDIYVFGSKNQDRGFRFTFGSIFNGIGNSLRKLFGFKEN